jgi:DNA-formamidopyrimidine glycosylase
MPEGPEIYSFGIELFNFFHNMVLSKIKILSGKYKRKPFKNYKISKQILPSKILSVSTHGKILLIELELDYFIIITFGMTGYLTTKSGSKHNKIEFECTNNKKIFYNDQRNFGNIYLLKSDIVYEKIKDLGPDLLDDRTNYEIFKNRFIIYKSKYPNRPIGLILLDQSFVSGIGNYLRADILYLSKISPYREIKNISKSELKKLYKFSYNLIRYYASIQIKSIDLTNLANLTNNHIIKSNLKYDLKITPEKYNRDFLIYGEKEDINGRPINRDKFYSRSIFWVKSIQI